MSSVVFVGNIPFDMTEEQVIDIFKDVGPVISFRLMFDKETGKPRGYGFCEFGDPETARSAIRNLNGLEIGGRTIKVDYADKETNFHKSAQIATPAAVTAATVVTRTTVTNNPLPPTTPTMEAVMAMLHQLDNEQLVKTITQLQALAQQSPEQAKMLLEGNPALAYALFQAMLSMRLIDQTTINAVIYGDNTNAPAQQQQQQQPKVLDPEAQRQMLAQIMAMTEEQVNALPVAQRDQVRLIRSQIMQRK